MEFTKLFIDQVNIDESISKKIVKTKSDNVTMTDNTNSFIHFTLSDSLNLTESILKDVRKFEWDSIDIGETIQQEAHLTLTIYDELILTDKVQKFMPFLYPIHLKGIYDINVYLNGTVDNPVYLIGDYDPKIHLVGGYDPVIYLEGESNKPIRLEGKFLMAADKQNFKMIQGDSKTIIITVNEDISGSRVMWGVKVHVDDPETYDIYKSTDTGGITLDGNIITIELEPLDTKTISGVFYHECEIVDPLGRITTITRGQIYIDKHAV